MSAENILDYKGDIEIIINVEGKSFVLARNDCKIKIASDIIELPDEHNGYVAHKLRKEEKLTITLVTEDNLDLTQEEPEVLKKNTKKKFDRNEYFTRHFPLN